MDSALYVLFAITLVIGIHEYGHYRMAVALGVQVERFSIGLGPVLWRFNRARAEAGTGTEYIIAALPLGGYVKMLDVDPSAPDQSIASRAFNRQSAGRRCAIVLAGPLANLLLAWLLQSAIFMTGVQESLPVLNAPAPGSLMAQAGLASQDRVNRIIRGDQGHEIRSYEDLRLQLIQAATQSGSITLQLTSAASLPRDLLIDLDVLPQPIGEAAWWQALGLQGPWAAPVLGRLLPQGQASQQGLQEGDRVETIDGHPMADARQLRDAIQSAVDSAGLPITQRWVVRRPGLSQPLTLDITVRAQLQEGRIVGRLDAWLGAPTQSVWTQLAWDAAAIEALHRLIDMGRATLSLMGKMLLGQASWTHVSGPVTMAENAIQSAQAGWTAYLNYLVWISFSLGLLNLLPIPVLDGGQLMCYLYESVRKKPLSPQFQLALNRVGLGIILALMVLALRNDLMRWWGGA